ncbi:hypothetical protein TRAPUB_6493 [Trametes pubescens]|uniref:Uncharacterized protein n=1 Tax=Trametes pubescens TaxID=154538 RepID=A0A1M2V5U8_TRAPU|nr:hypothetical protein TRAPUB_6493 [Trametes pubescens]
MEPLLQQSIARPWATKSWPSVPVADARSAWPLQEDEEMRDENAEGTTDEDAEGEVDEEAQVMSDEDAEGVLNEDVEGVLDKEEGSFEDVLREMKEIVELHKQYDLWEFFEVREEPCFWLLGQGNVRL